MDASPKPGENSRQEVEFDHKFSILYTIIKYSMRYILNSLGACGLKRVGVIGAGTIGSHIVRRAVEENTFRVVFVCDLDERRIRELAMHYRMPGPGEPYEVDLMVEAAEPGVLKEHAPRILGETHLLPFSLSAFADPEFEQEVLAASRSNGTRIYIPHGAIMGLDGLWDARSILSHVRITTTKPPRSFGRSDQARTVLYEGTTRQACVAYPRNVNVHAAVALCGVGFDRTLSTLISDPGCPSLQHVIEVGGKGVDFSIQVASRPLAGVTGLYTPESAYQTVKRLCMDEEGGLFLA